MAHRIIEILCSGVTGVDAPSRIDGAREVGRELQGDGSLDSGGVDSPSLLTFLVRNFGKRKVKPMVI